MNTLLVCRCRRLQQDGETHGMCVFCLGLEHAQAALQPKPACSICLHMPVKLRATREAYFHQTLPAAVTMASASEGVEEVKENKVLVQDPVDRSLPNMAPPLAEPPPGVGSSVSAEPVLPSIRRDLPGIMRRAAARLKIPYPPMVEINVEGAWEGMQYARPVTWKEPPPPPMISLSEFVESSWGAPLQVSAPAKSYLPFTAVEGRDKEVFQGIPPLDPSLAAQLAQDSSARVAYRKPQHKDLKDRVSSSFLEKSYKLSAQMVGASSNIALLASSMSSLTMGRDSLTSSEVEEIGKAASAILQMAEALAVCAGRGMAVTVVSERHLWLSGTTLKENQKMPLLNAPIEQEVLFGVSLAELTARLAKEEEERKIIEKAFPLKRHHSTAPPSPSSTAPRPKTRRQQTGFSQRRRESRATSEPFSRPRLPTEPTHQADSTTRETRPSTNGQTTIRPLAPTWPHHMAPGGKRRRK
ncbi:hypothetical protein UPYG_G00053840 [Umbra pygmaea]|uniref:Uncharacterized protein n=1 Tax=Umbra pygmaea TaxID=75934 RepID=A0ABD0X812_UMBPY